MRSDVLAYESLDQAAQRRDAVVSGSQPGLPGCDCLPDLSEVDYKYVGEAKGSYVHGQRGNFHYVGAGRGHYEREAIETERYRCLLVAIAIVTVLALSAVALLQILAPAPLFDCRAGLENFETTWSVLKQDYCCESRGLGCTKISAEQLASPLQAKAPEPMWLRAWMGDLSMETKFALSAWLAALLGFASGVVAYVVYLWLYAPSSRRRRHRSEKEVLAELKRTMKQAGAKLGELSVTLMWDTQDDLDLHVALPSGHGEISVERPAAAGGMLDVDGNLCMQVHGKNLENVFWPEVEPTRSRHPPIGDYIVWIKVYDKQESWTDAGYTVFTRVADREEVIHGRIPPDVTEVEVCSFRYNGPTHDFLNAPAGGGGDGSGGGRHEGGRLDGDRSNMNLSTDLAALLAQSSHGHGSMLS